MTNHLTALSPLDRLSRAELEAELLAARGELAVLRTQLETVQKVAYYDALTHLPNRHGYEKYLRELQALAQMQEFQTILDQKRSGGILVAQIDIDHFKYVNTMLTHFGGDAVLKQFAQRIAGCTRINALTQEEHSVAARRCLAALMVEAHLVRCGMNGSDLISRWGGEEFFCIFPLCYRDQAAAKAVYDDADRIIQRLMNNIRREPILVPVNDTTYEHIKHQVIGNTREYYQHAQLLENEDKRVALPISASIGYTVISWPELIASTSEDSSHLFRNVVDLMRRAKESGRNRAVTVRANIHNQKPSVHIYEGKPLDKTKLAEMMG